MSFSPGEDILEKTRVTVEALTTVDLVRDLECTVLGLMGPAVGVETVRLGRVGDHEWPLHMRGQASVHAHRTSVPPHSHSHPLLPQKVSFFFFGSVCGRSDGPRHGARARRSAGQERLESTAQGSEP
jgi:hypothetical protein